MKRLLIASAAMAIISTPILAAPQGTLLLQGQVSQVLNLVVTPEAGVNTSLDLVNGESDTKVATVTEETNSNTGYKILIRTANGGLLKNGSLDQVSYSMSYDGSPVTLSTTDTEVKNVSTGGVYDHDSDVEVSLTGSGSAAALTQGTYSDTVTFTIQVN